MVSKIDNISKIPSLGNDYDEQEAELAVSRYVNSILGTETKPIGNNLLEFFPLVQNAIRAREDEDFRKLLPREKEKYRRILALEEGPPEKIDTISITWKLKARVPGRFDQGPAGQGRIKEVVPHIRGIVDHPDHPNEKLISMGKCYGNWIEFNIYARNKKEALKRLLWFENIMTNFYWYFNLYGFKVIEEGVGDRETVTIDELEVTKYPVVYFVRSEDVYHVTSQELKNILITTNITKN